MVGVRSICVLVVMKWLMVGAGGPNGRAGKREVLRERTQPNAIERDPGYARDPARGDARDRG